MLYNQAYQPDNNLCESQWLSMKEEAELFDNDDVLHYDDVYYTLLSGVDDDTFADVNDTDLFDNFNY